MATPVGHFILGLSVLEASAIAPPWPRRRWLLAAVACLADLDVIPGLMVGQLARFHHGVTHSVGAAAIVSGLGLLLAVGQAWPRRLWFAGLIFALYMSHAALDAFTLDLSEPVGVPLLWPFSGASFQFPWPILPNVQHTRGPVVSLHNARSMVWESLLLLPLLGLTRAWRRSGPLASWRCWLYGMWLGVAVVVSIALVN